MRNSVVFLDYVRCATILLLLVLVKDFIVFFFICNHYFTEREYIIILRKEFIERWRNYFQNSCMRNISVSRLTFDTKNIFSIVCFICT